MVVLRPALPEPIQPFSRTATLLSAMFFGEIIGRRQAVTAAADNDHVIFGLWFRRPATPASSRNDHAAPGGPAKKRSISLTISASDCAALAIQRRLAFPFGQVS